MFNNPGNKLKVLAIVLTVILMLGSIIGGILIISNEGRDSWMGWPVLLGGTLFAWVSGLMMYGFGELIENSAWIVARLYGDEQNENSQQ